MNIDLTGLRRLAADPATILNLLDRIDALEADNETMQARLDNWHDLGDDLWDLLWALSVDGVDAYPALVDLRRRIREGQGVDG